MVAAGWLSPGAPGVDHEAPAMGALELLPEQSVVLSGAWSLLSVDVSEADAEDDWDDTDSLLPIDVSSVARLELLPTADTF